MDWTRVFDSSELFEESDSEYDDYVSRAGRNVAAYSSSLPISSSNVASESSPLLGVGYEWGGGVGSYRATDRAPSSLGTDSRGSEGPSQRDEETTRTTLVPLSDVVGPVSQPVTSFLGGEDKAVVPVTTTVATPDHPGRQKMPHVCKQSSGSQYTSWSLYCLTLNYILGVGSLGLPYHMGQVGFWPSLGLLLVVTVITYISVHLILSSLYMTQFLVSFRRMRYREPPAVSLSAFRGRSSSASKKKGATSTDGHYTSIISGARRTDNATTARKTNAELHLPTPPLSSERKLAYRVRSESDETLSPDRQWLQHNRLSKLWGWWLRDAVETPSMNQDATSECPMSGGFVRSTVVSVGYSSDAEDPLGQLGNDPEGTPGSGRGAWQHEPAGSFADASINARDDSHGAIKRAPVTLRHDNVTATHLEAPVNTVHIHSETVLPSSVCGSRWYLPFRSEMIHLVRFGLGNTWSAVYQFFLMVLMFSGLWGYTVVFVSAFVEQTCLFGCVSLNCLDSSSVLPGDQCPPDTQCWMALCIGVGLFSLMVIPLSSIELTDQVSAQFLLTMLRFVALFLMIIGSFVGAARSIMGSGETATATTVQLGVGVPAAEPSAVASLAPVSAVTWSSVGPMLATALFSQLFQHSVPPLVGPLRNKARAKPIFKYTLITTFVLYALLSMGTILEFGSKLRSSVNLNFATFDWGSNASSSSGSHTHHSSVLAVLNGIMVLFPALDTLSVFPLIAITLGNSVHAWLPKSVKRTVPQHTAKSLCRVLAAVPPIFLCFVFRNFAVTCQVAGICGVFIALLFPGALYWKLSKMAKRGVSTKISSLPPNLKRPSPRVGGARSTLDKFWKHVKTSTSPICLKVSYSPPQAVSIYSHVCFALLPVGLGVLTLAATVAQIVG